MMPREETFYLFGVRVDNTCCDAALERVRRYVGEKDGMRAREIFFTNVHSIRLARLNPGLRNCINHADLVLADGSGLRIAGKLFGTQIMENLNGTDFTPKVLEEAEKNGWSVYLLGAREPVVKQCRDHLLTRFPRLRIAGYHHGHYPPEEDSLIIDEINRLQVNVLLVALGSPRQEEWIARHAQDLHVGVCLAVGGLFDFISGLRKRAPLWIRRLGIEWIFRFFQDPASKWDRVFVEIPAFLFRLAANRVAAGRVKPAFVRKRSS